MSFYIILIYILSRVFFPYPHVVSLGEGPYPFVGWQLAVPIHASFAGPFPGWLTDQLYPGCHHFRAEVLPFGRKPNKAVHAFLGHLTRMERTASS